MIELVSAEENLFLIVYCILDKNQKVYISTELSDISLIDIIYCMIPIDEIHLSAILRQVSFQIESVAIVNI